MSKRRSPGDGHQIMDTSAGRITSVAVALSSKYNFFIQSILAALMAFFRAKSEDPGFSVVVIYDSDSIRKLLEEMLRSAGLDRLMRIKFVSAGKQELKGVWIRDDAVRRVDQSIVLPRGYRANGHELLAWAEGSPIQFSPLIYEGGDIRTTSSFMFVGIRTIMANVFSIEATNGSTIPDLIAFVVAAFETEFGKKVIIVGLTRNAQGVFKTPDHKLPAHHTDMILTPLGDKWLIVARNAQEPFFDIVAEMLVEQGFNVVRVPCRAIALPDDHFPGQLTFNNVLLEEYGSTKRVYLPHYVVGHDGESLLNLEQTLLDELNTTAASIYRSLGYSIVEIPMALSMPARGGSLNCLTFETRSMAG